MRSRIVLMIIGIILTQVILLTDATAASGESQVEMFIGDEVELFVMRGSDYDSLEFLSVAKMPSLPIPINRFSSKGFVEIEIDSWPVWVGLKDVRIGSSCNWFNDK